MQPQSPQGVRRRACAVGEESACGFERSKIGVWCQKTGLKRPEWLPPQIEHIGIVTLFVALPHRRLSFRKPSTDLVPLVVRVAEAVGLLTTRTLHGLLVRKHVGYDGSAVDDFG
jgi:hypothetical protein